MRLLRSCAITRAIVSVGPPGGNGTISLIGLLGYLSWARTIVGNAKEEPAPTIEVRTLRLVAMWSSRTRLCGRCGKHTTGCAVASAPQRRIGRISQPAVVAQSVRSVPGEQKRPIEIDDPGALGDQ